MRVFSFSDLKDITFNRENDYIKATKTYLLNSVMENEDQIIRAYSGSEVNCLHLKAELEKAGIISFIKDEFQSSINAGWASGSPLVLDLYIRQNDLLKAEEVLRSFMDLMADE